MPGRSFLGTYVFQTLGSDGQAGSPRQREARGPASHARPRRENLEFTPAAADFARRGLVACICAICDDGMSHRAIASSRTPSGALRAIDRERHRATAADCPCGRASLAFLALWSQSRGYTYCCNSPTRKNKSLFMLMKLVVWRGN